MDVIPDSLARRYVAHAESANGGFVPSMVHHAHLVCSVLALLYLSVGCRQHEVLTVGYTKILPGVVLVEIRVRNASESICLYRSIDDSLPERLYRIQERTNTTLRLCLIEDLDGKCGLYYSAQPFRHHGVSCGSVPEGRHAPGFSTVVSTYEFTRMKVPRNREDILGITWYSGDSGIASNRLLGISYSVGSDLRP